MADRAAGRRGPTTTSTVRDEDWYGEDLTGRVVDAVAYIGIDMTETTSTSGLTFNDCTFRGIRFNVASHIGASFANCTFSDCRFFSATFTDCKFLGAMFEACTFDQLAISGGDWSYTGLPGADLRRAKIDRVRLREADLTGARCDGASITGCDLSGAWLGKASFDGCDLRGSDLSAFDPWTVSLRDAVIDPIQAMTVVEAMGIRVQPPI